MIYLPIDQIHVRLHSNTNVCHNWDPYKNGQVGLLSSIHITSKVCFVGFIVFNEILYKYILLVRVICEKYRLRGEANIPSRFTFASPLNRYFSQITLTNRIYLFNSVEYLAANKTVACKQDQNFRPPRSFDFQLRRDVINYLKKGFRLERDIFLQYRDICRQISRQWWKS